MRSWFAILVTLVACKGRDVERMSEIKAAVCACNTASCAEQAMARVPKDLLEPSQRIQTIARDMMECLAKLQAGERPTTDPDAEGSAAGPAPGSGAAAPAAPAPAPAH